jgi:hypothetical protein
MRRSPVIIFVLSSAAFVAAPSAFAHHGWGSYDADKPMTVEAAIEEVMLSNPHGMMMVTTGGRRWEVTLAPLSRMQARGAAGGILAKGKRVKAHGYPKRDGTPEMRAEWIEVDGRRYELR